MHLDEVGRLRLMLGIPLPVGGDVGKDGEQDEGELQLAATAHQSGYSRTTYASILQQAVAPGDQTLLRPWKHNQVTI
jgi:hypothetical protein